MKQMTIFCTGTEMEFSFDNKKAIIGEIWIEDSIEKAGLGEYYYNTGTRGVITIKKTDPISQDQLNWIVEELQRFTHAFSIDFYSENTK